MNKEFDLILRHAKAMLHADATNSNANRKSRWIADSGSLSLQTVDIGVRDGKIAAIEAGLKGPFKHEINLTGLTVLPGVIDSQVHFREPGLEHKEDLESGTRSAILGGITSVFEMPNTNPSTTTSAALRDKFTRANGRAWTDIAFFVGASHENYATVNELETSPGTCGIKIFMGASYGSLLVSEDEMLFEILRNGKRRIAIHAEDEARLNQRKEIVKSSHRVQEHHVWRDAISAMTATARITALAKACRRDLHLLHISTGEEIEFLARYVDSVTVEVLPQHLTLSAPECYERLGTLAQMNPPIREKHHQDILWEGIRKRIVTVLGTDHAPHTLEEKSKTYPDTPSGMTGVQTFVPVMLDHVNRGRLSLSHLVELICDNPGRLYGHTGKGQIRIGFDADFTVVDLKKEKQVTRSEIASKSGWSPYEGMTFTGWPVKTFVRGHLVMQDGQTVDRPLGQPINFQVT